MKKSYDFSKVFPAFIFLASVYLFMPTVLSAEPVEKIITTLSGSNRAVMAFAAMAAVGISCITSAYALAKIGAAAMGAMSEKPEIGGRALVFLGMAEGIAIYGLIIAIMILNKI